MNAFSAEIDERNGKRSNKNALKDRMEDTQDAFES